MTNPLPAVPVVPLPWLSGRGHAISVNGVLYVSPEWAALAKAATPEGLAGLLRATPVRVIEVRPAAGRFDPPGRWS